MLRKVLILCLGLAAILLCLVTASCNYKEGDRLSGSNPEYGSGTDTTDKTVITGNTGIEPASTGKNSDKGKSAAGEMVTLVKADDSTLDFYSPLSDGSRLILRIAKKSWGTWNIRGLYKSDDGSLPANKPYIMAGGESDWEYVLRASYDAETAGVFSGGSHGREKLTDLKILDGNSMSEVSPSGGEQLNAESYIILENTELFIGDNYGEAYADVARKYYIYPSRVVLETAITFKRNVFMGTTYVCMLPVLKDYGSHILFEDTGSEYSTPLPGTTLTTPDLPNYLGKEKSLSAVVWGDSRPQYKIRAWIDNADMVDGFSNDLKTFYWDLNTVNNKLYFSKYNDETYVEIPAGTSWNNRAGWEFSIENN